MSNKEAEKNSQEDALNLTGLAKLSAYGVDIAQSAKPQLLQIRPRLSQSYGGRVPEHVAAVGRSPESNCQRSPAPEMQWSEVRPALTGLRPRSISSLT